MAPGGIVAGLCFIGPAIVLLLGLLLPLVVVAPEQADALLLGRKTYEGFAEAWPQRSGDPYTDKINAMPKHVASRTLEHTTWNASILEGDAATAVAELKRQEGENLLKFGSGSFSKTLGPLPRQSVRSVFRP